MAGASVWTTKFGPELVTKDGLKATDDVLAGKKIVCIYFSVTVFSYRGGKCRFFWTQNAKSQDWSVV